VKPVHLAPIALLMVQVAVVILTSRVLARVVRALGQPTVIAEIVAGIVLGPSVLGLLWPDALAALFPATSLDGLSLVSQLGLIFFMFLVGLEFDPKLLAGRGHQSLVVSWASILVPLALGAGLAVPLHAPLAPEGVRLLPFALFMGAAMSITAFPVLARILAERGVLRTPVGAVALSSAAVGDVTAWCILAFVVSIARADGMGSAVVTTTLALGYIALVWKGVRPLLARLGPRQGQALSAETVAIVFLIVLASATVTELIGIHALFGAFLVGAVMPRGGGLAHALTEKLEDFVTIALLPLFFAFSGLRTRLGLLEGTEDWLYCGVIVLVACLGKFGGSAVAGRLVGMGWREASAVGVLMNTRGLMELIVLNVGLDLGVLSPRLFAMMVIMAVVTTWITSPLLERIYPRREMLRSVEATPEPTAPAPTPTLICVSDPAIAPALVAVGRHLVTGDEALLALHLVRSDRPSAYLGGGPAPERQEALEVVQDRADALGVRVRTLSYVAEDPARDIVRVAEAKSVGLVILGSHRPLLTEGELGGVVRRVLATSVADVAVLVDRGLADVRSIRVIGDDEAVRSVADRMRRGGLAEGQEGGLLVAPLGTPVPDGMSALLVRRRRS
jgi:Kef-type K+ transport system membrane component KefB